MHENKIVLTWEAIYDLTDIVEYIEMDFGRERADAFQNKIKEQINTLAEFSTAFPKTNLLYRNYVIRKRTFPPSIIFYAFIEDRKEIHILRVLREERDWKQILEKKLEYKYPDF